MRIAATITAVTMIGLLCLTGSRQQEGCAVTVKMIDASTGEELPGLLRITDEAGNAIQPDELLSRGLGLEKDAGINRWSVLTKRAVIRLPRKKLKIEAISGLETDLASKSIDLTGKSTAAVTLKLTRFYSASEKGWRSANTHLHLQKLTRRQSDRYLSEIPKADGLDALFVSYLERAVADREYITNKYTDGDLASLSKRSGVVLGNGEEHRHNLTGFGQGYGHVMLLNIDELIQPVSIGPGIMKMGTDGIPLQRGIDQAHRDGATVLWCHNNWGMESIPNFVTGRVDAQNIFDGGTHGSYKDSFYRYLNAGLKVPFSTGTDWFIYDFSRVYVDMDGKVTVGGWLKSLAEGRSYITNGPLLEFTVSGKKLGETVKLKRGGRLRLNARAVGRTDFGRIEIVQNGKVIASEKSKARGGHFQAAIKMTLDANSPSWLTLRTPPPPVKDDPKLQEPVNKNELGKDLFAHTSPIYVEVNGKHYFDRGTALQLLTEMGTNRKLIETKAKFADDQDRARVLDVYRDGIDALKRRLVQR